MVLAVFDKIGAAVLEAMDTFGDFAVLAGRAFFAIFKRPFDGKNLLNQFHSVGVNSIPVVVLTCLAVSMVFAVQLAFGFRQFQAEGLASQVEGLAVMRELAPVITGLMMARAASARPWPPNWAPCRSRSRSTPSNAWPRIRSSILFVPRLLASMLVVPLLTGRVHLRRLLGGYLLLVGVEGQSAYVYGKEFYKLLAFRDLRIAIYKGLVFGMIIALVGCWRGYRTRGGAEGVGNAPTSSVVTSSLWILIADFFLTKLLLV